MKNLIIIATLLLLSSFVGQPDEYQILETINTLEDLKEWIEYDAQSNLLDEKIADTYIYNIDECLARLNK